MTFDTDFEIRRMTSKVCLSVNYYQLSSLLSVCTPLSSQLHYSTKMYAPVDKCIFCQICMKKQETELLLEDDEIVVFKDIKPAAKHHYLAVPKQHIRSAKELKLANKPLLEKLISSGLKVLEERGGDKNDVRLGFHWPPFMSVSHLHLHVISPASEMGFFGRQVFKPNTWWFATSDYVMEHLENKL